jgi:hypothetical protein
VGGCEREGGREGGGREGGRVDERDPRVLFVQSVTR